MADFAERLKEIMDIKGLKQVDVIKLCEPVGAEYGIKIGKSHMSQYISGKTQPRTSLGYNAPVGLFGLIITIAFVLSVIFFLMSSMSGYQSACSSHR